MTGNARVEILGVSPYIRAYDANGKLTFPVEDTVDEESEAMVPLRLLSAALDEIYCLRVLAARTAVDVESSLSYKSIPGKVRLTFAAVIGSLKRAANGGVLDDPVKRSIGAAHEALTAVGARSTFTRTEFEAEVAERARRNARR